LIAWGLQGRDDYIKYNKIAGVITKLTAKLKALPQDVRFRLPSVARCVIHLCQPVRSFAEGQLLFRMRFA